jgi:hypothetical protein
VSVSKEKRFSIINHHSDSLIFLCEKTNKKAEEKNKLGAEQLNENFIDFKDFILSRNTSTGSDF